MRETHRRIAEYKRILPGLKEKVVAVALLLAMSTAMVTTVSFAWFAISRNPAVTGVNTTIAANGNLEIALVPSDGSVPRESLVGDSNLPTTERNLTWGNLVNLSDSAYGLDNLVLRPAMLNSYSLSTNPLYGPIYDTDGRVIDLNTNFGYSIWNAEMLRFDYTTGYGVRAISSMTYGTSSASKVYNEGLNKVNAMNMNVQNRYEALANNGSYMNALSSIIANYMAYSLIQKGSGVADYLNTPTVTATNLGYLADMYEEFIVCFEEEADAFAAFLEFQKMLSESTDEWADITHTITGEEILARTDANATAKTVYNDLKTKGYICASKGFVQEIDQFVLDYQTLVNDISNVRAYQTKALENGGKLNWNDELTALISNLVNMDKCELYDESGTKYTVGGIGGTAAMGLVGQTVDAYINNGIFLRFENRSGARLYAENVKFSLDTKIGNQSINGNIQTSATENYFENERANTATIIENYFGAPDYIANDTYGLALDMWVRTNGAGTYLTLQGNVLTETKTERAMGKDANGNSVELWTVTVATESEESGGTTVGDVEIQLTQSYDVYQKVEKDEGGNDITNWYYVSNHVKVDDSLVYELDADGNRTDTLLAKEKWEEVEYVIGYDGENRVWNGSAYADLTVNSSTQGSGSCYVFYADPADQLRTLTLLKAMKVAFVDENGVLLATAYLDTERYFAESGKVIVPLVLDPATSISVGTDINGDTIYGITSLEQNVPLRITSILYLDGNGLGNEDVLASADIQGQLNIQFGGSNEMNSIKNETLYNSVIEASASVSKSSFDYDTDTDLTTKVTVNIDGVEPKSVKAFFIREINASQGVREKVFELTQLADGSWTYDYTFDYPGTYILRSVQIDGTEYDLVNNPYPRVVVEGFAIADVTYNLGEIIMSDKNSYSGEVVLKFATDDISKMPSKVQGNFVREDGTSSTVNFTYNPTNQMWVGTATFGASGVYTMDFVTLDGRITPLAEGDRFTIDLKLGMRVEVRTTTYPTTFGSEDEDAPEKLVMQVEIVDNSGEPVIGLANARLNYVNAGGSASTLETKLTWNQDLECYEGELQAREGIWKFNYVTVAMGSGSGLTTSILTTATNTTPVFTIVPPDPPSMSATQPVVDMYQYVKGADGVTTGATVSVNLDGATAATVVGKITKASGEVKYVLGALKTDLEASEGDVETVEFEFILPEGEWTLTDVYAWNVYGEKTAGAETAPFYSLPLKDGTSDSVTVDELVTLINNADTRESTLATAYRVGATDATVAALYNVNVTISHEKPDGENVQIDTTNKLVTFGKNDSGTVQSLFMDTHTVDSGDIKIEFTDDNSLIASGKFNISGVTLGINYSKFSTNYGSYSSNNENTNVLVQDALKFTASGNVATLNDTLTLQYAARYDMGQLTYTVNDESDDTTVGTTDVVVSDVAEAGSGINGYVYEVWSKAPVVTVSATNPIPGTIKRIYTVKTPVNTAQAIQGDFFSFSDYKATVYIYTPAATGGYDQEAAEAFAPEVTLKLSGLPDGYDSATMVFTTNNSDSNSSTFSFSNGTATAKVGKAVTGERGLFGVSVYPKCYPAGTMTQNKVTITYGDIVYEVTIDNAITIDQPQSPTALNFVGIPNSYTGTTPSQVIGVGTSVTVTLPSLYWNARIEEPSDGTWSAYVPVGEVAEVGGKTTKAYSYTTWVVEGNCSDTTYYTYQYFTWTKFQSSITAETDIYTQDKKIVQWVINGKTYNAGETITVTGDGIITATAVVSDNGAKTFVETLTQTTYKYLYGYVAESKVTKTETAPNFSYNLIGIPGTTENAALASAKIANVSNADAATDTLGINTTTDSGAYADFLP